MNDNEIGKMVEKKILKLQPKRPAKIKNSNTETHETLAKLGKFYEFVSEVQRYATDKHLWCNDDKEIHVDSTLRNAFRLDCTISTINQTKIHELVWKEVGGTGPVP